MNKLLSTSLSLIGTAAAVALTASASQAAALSFGGITGTADLFTVGGTYSSLQDAGYSATGIEVDPAKSSTNKYLTPGADTVFSQDTKFQNPSTPGVRSYSVASTGDKPDGVTSEIEITGLTGALSFLWGSVDTYNTINFFDGGTNVGSLTGTTLATALGSFTANTAGNYNIDALVSFAGTFDKAVLTTSGIAFEVAAASVPEASGISTLLLIGGVAGGFALKNRLQQA